MSRGMNRALPRHIAVFTTKTPRSQRFSGSRSASLRYLLLASSILIYIVIVLGGIVRASGPACPDWPTCFGSWLPPVHAGGLVEYAHRLATLLVIPLMMASVGLAWMRARHQRWIVWPVSLAMGVMLLQVLLGKLATQAGASDRPSITAVHLGLSLLVQGLLLVSTVVVFYTPVSGELPGGLVYRSRFSRLAVWTAVALFVLMVSGVLVAGSGSTLGCKSWPLCGGSLMPGNSAGWINLIHRGVVALTAGLVLAVFLRAWRTQRTQTPVLVAATTTGVLFLAQALMGAYSVHQAFPPYLTALHQATAVAVWVGAVALVATTGLASRTSEEEKQEAGAIGARKGLWRDLMMLTKPVVVLLLLVTTFAGMVIGAQAWPSFSLVFWTLLGGFMAAGGSGAINQYIDREDDQRMQRTQKRPIPSGRLTPGEGLAFGVAMCLGSFYILVVYVNLLAALLSLAGIIYYVLLYSIFLKKTTVQNIVIGGGAGAIPPLVGWAAATGSLNVPSLFLFAIVFMWTPPHFWALALVRRKDYARAGVPMLPVVRGEKATRGQILLYTLELVGLTLFLPLFGLGGSLYLVSAVVLGGLLVFSAWRVWKGEGNKAAWKMYRHSSMYLAFLFVALMVDRLVIH